MPIVVFPATTAKEIHSEMKLKYQRKKVLFTKDKLMNKMSQKMRTIDQ